MIVLALVLVGCDYDVNRTKPETFDTILAVCHRNDGVKTVDLRDSYGGGVNSTARFHVVSYRVVCKDAAIFVGEVKELLP